MKLFRYNQFINENVTPLSVLDSSEYEYLKAGDVIKSDLVVKEMLDDIEQAAKAMGVHVNVTCAITDHAGIHDDYSRHPHGQALDLAQIGFDTTPHEKLRGNPQSPGGAVKNQEFVDAADKLVDGLIQIGYKLITQDPQLRQKYSSSLASSESRKNPKILIWKYYSKKAGNHYNHIHISNTGGVGRSSVEINPMFTDDEVSVQRETPTPIDSNQIQKIYTKQNDPYSYCVINGNWFIKGGPDKPVKDWYFFDDWTPLEMNCKLIASLDKKFRDARNPADIELNRQKFCSIESEIENNRKEWLEMVGADEETIKLGKNSESNNNPGKLKFFDGYKGCIGDSEGYCKFEKLCFGYGAILNLLTTYYIGYQLNTIKKIIEYHNPPIDGDTSDYIQVVTSISGISLNQNLEIGDLVKLIPGIVKKETDEDVSLEEVINFINESENEKIVIPQTITNKGEHSTIIAPIGVEGELPFLIIYPSYNDPYLIVNTIIKDFSDWTTKYGFIFADDYDTKWEDILRDFESKTPNLSFKSTTIVLSDQSINPNVMYNLQSIPKIQNLILINLEPNNEIISSIKNVAKISNVYATYDMNRIEESSNKEEFIKFIVDFKSAITEVTKGTDKEGGVDTNVKGMTNVSPFDFPKETFTQFKSNLEQSIS
jgi:hypothetical protein